MWSLEGFFATCQIQQWKTESYITLREKTETNLESSFTLTLYVLLLTTYNIALVIYFLCNGLDYRFFLSDSLWKMSTFTRVGPHLHSHLHLLQELHLGYDKEMMLPPGVAASVAPDVAAGTDAVVAAVECWCCCCGNECFAHRVVSGC